MLRYCLMSFELGRSEHADATSHQDSNLLLWADCEFTGLDIAKGHRILELGAVATDLMLNEVDNFQSFIHYDWSETEKLMDQNPWWNGRTEDKERMRLGMKDAPTVQVVDNNLSDFVLDYFGNTQPPLCGNTIGNDKKHIDDQLPKTSSLLSYRVVDVTSLKIIANRYRSIEFTGKIHKHFAIDDIRESISEFKFLLNMLGISQLSAQAIENS